MGTKATATERERREWSCPNCGSLIDPAERFSFLFEYQRYMEAAERSGAKATPQRPRFACRNCLDSPEVVEEENPARSGGWVLWLAVGLLSALFGLTILSVVVSWLS